MRMKKVVAGVIAVVAVTAGLITITCIKGRK